LPKPPLALRKPSSFDAVLQSQQLPAFLAAILTSRTFEKSPTLCNLLVYLWENRDGRISEYAIATEALGRSSDFDSKIDATVRVQISRLRQRLERYYREEDVACGECISIPLGSHGIELTMVGGETAVGVRGVSTPLWANVSFLRRCCAMLIVAVVALAAIPALRGVPAAPALPAPRFWRAFFVASRPTQIVLSTPVFYSWHMPEHGNVFMFRNTDLNRFEEKSKSHDLLELERHWGPSEPAQNYTVTTDAFAAIKLVRYLDRVGFPTVVWSSSDAEIAQLARNNVIAMGTWGTLIALKPYLDRLSFVLGPHET
jgi:hypothetical protein